MSTRIRVKTLSVVGSKRKTNVLLEGKIKIMPKREFKQPPMYMSLSPLHVDPNKYIYIYIYITTPDANGHAFSFHFRLFFIVIYGCPMMRPKLQTLGMIHYMKCSHRMAKIDERTT